MATYRGPRGQAGSDWDWVPWWMWAAGGVAGFFYLRFWLPTHSAHEGIAGRLVDTLHGWAWVPLVAGLAIAGLRWERQASRARLLDRQEDIETLRQMSWRDFERLVAECFARQGYRVQENGGGGADGGVDVVLRDRQGRIVLVQVKHWRGPVGVSIVRELYGVMAAEGAAAGIVVTCGGFTRDAKAFAEGKALDLIGGYRLLRMINDVQR